MPIENCTYCNNEFDAEGENEFCSEECRDLGEQEKKCEHELILNDENWLSESTVMATAECGLCKAQFGGLLIKNG